MTKRPRVAHIITRLIVGGAQENTLASVIGHRKRGRYDADLILGPTYGSEGSLLPLATELGVTGIRIPTLMREINPLADPIALLHLAWRLKRGRYDVVHTHSSKAGILGRVAARMAGVSVIVHTAHGWGFTPRQPSVVQRMFQAAERFCASLTDALVVVSPLLLEAARESRIGRPEQYVTIRSGIDVSHFETPTRSRGDMRKELGIPAEARVIGSVMRLSAQKAPLELVEIAALVMADHADVHLCIAGDGPLRSQTEALVRERGIASRVHLLGLRDDVRDVLPTFDVFVLPSLWEGLPRVLPQAMAAGVPVVASRVDGNAEIVRDGDNGFLLEVDDRAGFAHAVTRILGDGALADRLRQAGRASLAEFGVDKMVDDIETLYDRLLAARGGR